MPGQLSWHSVKEPVPPFVPEHEHMLGRPPIDAQMALSSLQAPAVGVAASEPVVPEAVGVVVVGVVAVGVVVVGVVGEGEDGAGDGSDAADEAAEHEALLLEGHCFP